jgi:hypothetical protein
MLSDQSRYDDEDKSTSGDGFEDGDVELTEENADDFIKYINGF